MKMADFPHYLTSFLGKYLPWQKNVSHDQLHHLPAHHRIPGLA